MISEMFIGGFSLKLGSNATHLSTNATIFAKGCCIQLRSSVLCATSFYKYCLQFYCSFLICREHIAWIGACLKRHHIFKVLFFKQCHTFCKGLLHTLRNGVLYALSFYKCCLFFLHFLWRTYCMNWCLFRMHMFWRAIAYVLGNPCRDVGPIHS